MDEDEKEVRMLVLESALELEDSVSKWLAIFLNIFITSLDDLWKKEEIDW